MTQLLLPILLLPLLPPQGSGADTFAAAAPTSPPQEAVFNGRPLVTAIGKAAVAAALDGGEREAHLSDLRVLRNSASVLGNVGRLHDVTREVERAMLEAYGDPIAADNATANVAPVERPGNFHGVKSHTYYVGAISEAHPSLPTAAVQSLVASEWYHPGLAAKAVWCTEDCAERLPLAERLEANFEEIQREVTEFWQHSDAHRELQGVGSHTTQFDRLIAGNGTWADVRLWRGRAFNRRLCEEHFRTICGLVEASPEVWTNPWSHVLLSVLFEESWVPFHQGHTNGQLTYHLPVRLPRTGGVAELAVVDRGGALPDDELTRGKVLSHPEERTVQWREGRTLVFDDSFTHAVRFRSKRPTDAAHGKETPAGAAVDSPSSLEARVVLLMRAWHPELLAEERRSLREFLRRGGEEHPVGYEKLPISPSAFSS